MYNTLQRKLCNIRNLIASIRESVMNIHEQFMNVCNALFHELNNFHALALELQTHMCFYISNCEIGYEHSTSTYQRRSRTFTIWFINCS